MDYPLFLLQDFPPQLCLYYNLFVHNTKIKMKNKKIKKPYCCLYTYSTRFCYKKNQIKMKLLRTSAFLKNVKFFYEKKFHRSNINIYEHNFSSYILMSVMNWMCVQVNICKYVFRYKQLNNNRTWNAIKRRSSMFHEKSSGDPPR